jgi:hypothetical protein
MARPYTKNCTGEAAIVRVKHLSSKRRRIGADAWRPMATRNPIWLASEREDALFKVGKSAEASALLKQEFPWSPDHDKEPEIAQVIKAINRCRRADMR